MESKATQKAHSPQGNPDSVEKLNEENNLSGAPGATVPGAPGAAPEITNLRNFRHSPEIENFYRFVDEFNLRREARLIFERVYGVISNVKKKKKSRSSKSE